MNKLHGDRRPTAPAKTRQARRFTPRATVTAERANNTGALAQFDPEKTERGMAPPTPPAPVAAAAKASPRDATPSHDVPRRDPSRRWPPAPIWLGAFAVLIAVGAWGTSQIVGGTASPETVVASAAPAPSVVEPPAAPAVQPPPAAPVAVTAVQSPVSPPPTVVKAAARLSTPAAPRRTVRPAATAAPARPAPLPARTAELVRQPGFRGSLIVSSEPAGARVLVNGREVGVTPLALHDVAAGSRVVRVEADGYDPWSAAVRVVADQETQVTATLRR